MLTSTENFSISATMKFSIMNPLNTDIEAAYIIFLTNTTIKIDMQSDFKLTGQTLSLNLDVLDFKTLFKADETIEDIKEKMKGVTPLLKKALDQSLETGIEVPIPHSIKRGLRSEKL